MRQLLSDMRLFAAYTAACWAWSLAFLWLVTR